MKKKKMKLILAFIPTNISLIIALTFFVIAYKSTDFVEIAYYLLGFIFIALAFAGIRPIFLYFNKIKVLEYVEMRYNKLERLKEVLNNSNDYDAVFKNKDGTPTIYVKEAQEALTELGYNGYNLIDFLYDGVLSINEIMTPIEMLIDQTVSPFRSIPYQFLMLVR